MTSHNRTGRDKNNSRKAVPKDLTAGKGKEAPEAAAAPAGQQSGKPGTTAEQPAGKQSGNPGTAQRSKAADQANRSNKDMPGREPSRNGKR